MKQSKKLVAAMLMVVVLIGKAAACAQGRGGSFPSKAIEVVVPYSAGGETDVFTRFAIETLKSGGIVKADFVISNKPGGSTAIGHKYIKQEEGNDYIILSSASSLLTGSLLSADTPDFAEFTAIAQIGASSGVWAVGKDSPIQTVEDLVAKSKTPEGVTVAIGALGTLDHFAILKLADLTGGNFVPVPNDSAGQAVIMAMNGSADVVIANPGTLIGQVQAGEVRLLATTSPARIPGIDVPTFSELGYAIEFYTPKAIMAPKGISDKAKEYYIEAFRKLTESESWKKYLDDQFTAHVFLFGDEFHDTLKKTQDELKPLFESAGLIQS